MDKLKQSLMDFAEKNGADILGFAPKKRFNGLDSRSNPFSVFPKGETVIVLGKRICRGSLRGVEEGSNFFDYNLFGNLWLEDEFIATMCYDMAQLIEDAGWEAVPVVPNAFKTVDGEQNTADMCMDFNYAAIAAGVAEMGYNGLLLSDKFGPRQKFHMIITDAVIEPTPILEKSICDQCGKCVKACPLNAISADAYETIEVCGKKMKVAKIDYSLCEKCKNGAYPNRFNKGGKPDRVAAVCNRACLIHLEEEKRINNLFENKFRQSPAWALDEDGKYVK